MSGRREKRKKEEAEREKERGAISGVVEERTRTEEPSNGPIPELLSIPLSITLRIVMNSEEPPRFTGHGTFVFLPTANLLYVSVSLRRAPSLSTTRCH